MIKVSKYPMIVISIAIIGLFVLPKLNYPNRLVDDVTCLLVSGFVCVWALKHGCEGLADRRQIKGEPTSRQIMGYRNSINMLILGLMGLLFIILFALFLSSFRISDWVIINWGLKGH